MTYRGEQIVPTQGFDDAKYPKYTIEYVARQIVHRIIDTMSFEDLQYVFAIEINDPRAEDFRQLVRNALEKEKYKKADFLMRLDGEQQVQITASLTLNK